MSSSTTTVDKETGVRVREYVFNPGIIPSDRGSVHQWHGHAMDGTTAREVFERGGIWTIRWIFTPNR